MSPLRVAVYDNWYHQASVACAVRANLLQGKRKPKAESPKEEREQKTKHLTICGHQTLTKP
eukprot:6217586-Amphidinium_carterae.1